MMDPRASRGTAVIFLHLPKTAGTSLREILRQRYDPTRTYDEPPPPRELVEAQMADLRLRGARIDGPLPSAFAPRFLSELASLDERRRRSFRLAMGHFWFGVHEFLPQPSTYITLLRDPVDRVLSLYAHRTHVQGLDVSLERYVRDARDPQVLNDQVRRIGGDPSLALESVRVDRNTLELAKARLHEHFPVVGIAEDFEGTLRLLRDRFGWSEELPSVSENVSEWRPKAEEVPSELIAEIRELNALDLELYAFVRDLMGERLRRIGRSAAAQGNGTARAVRFPPVVGAEEPASDEWQTLLFLHIPKTAGLNLRHVINYQYGLENVCVPEAAEDMTRRGPYWRYLEEGTSLPHKGTPGFDPNIGFRRRLLAWTERGNTPRVVMGHFWFGLHEEIPHPSSYFTILREPMERTLSVYFHRRNQYGFRLSLEEWIHSARDFQLDNAQTRFLCGRLPDEDVWFTKCTPEMLELAKRNLRERFSVVGITERFDEAYLLMARTFGWRVSGYDVYNVNRRRPRGDAIPNAIRQRLEERNRFDAELYEFARALFEEQLAALDPPIDERSLRGLRRSNLLHRSTSLRRIYPVARPMLRAARAVGRTAKRMASGNPRD